MQIGRTELEILEHLLARGGASAGSIARLTGLKRPTVYAALERLQAGGIVREVQPTKGSVRFHAAAPKAIRKALEEDAERRLLEAKREASRIEERLLAYQKAAPQTIAGYEIRALESRSDVYLQLEQALLKGNYCAIFNPQIVCVGEVKEIVLHFLKESGKKKPPIREICVSGPLTDWYVSNIHNPNHLVRTLPKDATIQSDMIMIDGSVILSHYSPMQELAIRITQSDYYQTMMGVFESLWRGAEGA